MLLIYYFVILLLINKLFSLFNFVFYLHFLFNNTINVIMLNVGVMRRKIIKYSIDRIKSKYPEYSEEKLDEIEYGLEAIYITLTKAIVIFLVSLSLGVLKEVFYILLFYNIIRTTAFGMHAKTSLQCYVISGLLFVGAGLICKYFYMGFYLKLIISVFCFLNILLFAPADTYKRPLINSKKRNLYKILSFIISYIYVALILLFYNSDFSNYLLFGLVDITVMIHPITYRVFQLPYNNYKTYNSYSN